MWYVYLICDILFLWNRGVPRSHFFLYVYVTCLYDWCFVLFFLSDGNSHDGGKENHPPMMTPIPSKRRRLGPPEGCKVEIRKPSTRILHFSLKEQEVHSLWPCTYLTAVNNLTKRFYLSVLGFHWILWLFLTPLWMVDLRATEDFLTTSIQKEKNKHSQANQVWFKCWVPRFIYLSLHLFVFVFKLRASTCTLWSAISSFKSSVSFWALKQQLVYLLYPC